MLICCADSFFILLNDSVIEFQEAHKLLQPADKTLKELAVELAEYQV
jgi:hypothetical protein